MPPAEQLHTSVKDFSAAVASRAARVHGSPVMLDGRADALVPPHAPFGRVTSWMGAVVRWVGILIAFIGWFGVLSGSLDLARRLEWPHSLSTPSLLGSIYFICLGLAFARLSNFRDRRASILSYFTLAIALLSVLYILAIGNSFLYALLNRLFATNYYFYRPMGLAFSFGALVAGAGLVVCNIRSYSVIKPISLSVMGLLTFTIGAGALLSFTTNHFFDDELFWGAPISVFGACAFLLSGIGLVGLSWKTFHGRILAPHELWLTTTVSLLVVLVGTAVASTTLALLPIYNQQRSFAPERLSSLLGLKARLTSEVLQSARSRFLAISILLSSEMQKAAPLSAEARARLEDKLKVLADPERLFEGIVRIGQDGHTREFEFGAKLPDEFLPSAAETSEAITVRGPYTIDGRLNFLLQRRLDLDAKASSRIDVMLMSVAPIEQILINRRGFSERTSFLLSVSRGGKIDLFSLPPGSEHLLPLSQIPSSMNAAIGVLGDSSRGVTELVSPGYGRILVKASVRDSALNLLAEIPRPNSLWFDEGWIWRFMALVVGVALLGAGALYYLASEAFSQIMALNAQVRQRSSELTRESAARQRIEGDLKLSTSRTDSIVMNAPYGILSVTREGILEHVNSEAQHLLGASGERATGQPLEKFIPDLGWDSLLRELDAGEVAVSRTEEHTVKRGDGSSVICEVRVVMTRIQEHAVVTVFLRDLTLWKEQDERIRRSLHERDALLKEIHHRVNNNLQMISSFLSLQARTLKDDAALEALAETRHRVHAVALVHQLFYQSGELIGVDMNSYCSQLGAALLGAYSARERVKIRVSGSELVLPLEHAIPCGIILNELISSSLRYSYSEQRSGAISVALSRNGNEYRLDYEDDGSMPASFDWEGTLGLRLVMKLGPQINGEVVRRPESTSGGAKYSIIGNLVNKFLSKGLEK